MLTDAKKKEKVRRERARLQVLLPCEFADGARCGLTGNGDLDRQIIEGAQDD